MKKIITMLLAILILLLVTSCGVESQSEKEKVKIDESNTDVKITQLNDKIWVHKSYIEYEGKKVSANGLVVETSEGIVLIDTPWTNEQTSKLIDILKKEIDKEISKSIVTHAHDDTIGGIDKLIEKNIDVIAIELTAVEAEKNGFGTPNIIVESNQIISVDDTEFEIFYPGHGHSLDNIVVWIPKYKILYGGCIIKSLESIGLGNTDDANIIQWKESVEKIESRYKDVKVVVPGHGLIGDNELIEHTIKLIDENRMLEKKK